MPTEPLRVDLNTDPTDVNSEQPTIFRGDVLVARVETDEDASLIVRAVNSHAELVSTLEQARAALDMWATGKAMSRADVWTITNAALAASAAALAKAKE